MQRVLDWQRYKELCDRPTVFSRWMLEQTRELVDGPLAEALDVMLDGPPLARPAGHRGGRPTDMLELRLSLDQCRAIQRSVAGAVARGVTTSGTRSRGLGGFLPAWQECVEHLAGKADRVQ